MKSIMEGRRVPDTVFKTREEGKWKEVTSKEIFDGKSVVVFALPGAFTPTCSSAHVPRYEELYDNFKVAGIDTVACVSVNDAFVMDEWKIDQNVKKLLFLPDGNGEFTEKMGMLVDKSDLGFGKRSWRYSMLVKNNKIEKIFSEPDSPGDPFEVSDADTMLDYLNPKAKKPVHATIFTRNFCPHCARAKKLLRQEKIKYSEIVVGKDLSAAGFRAIYGKGATVPQIYIEGKHIGGADDLEEWLG